MLERSTTVGASSFMPASPSAMRHYIPTVCLLQFRIEMQRFPACEERGHDACTDQAVAVVVSQRRDD